MRVFVLLATPLLSGCLYFGLAAHPESYDSPNVNLSSGLGVVRFEHKFKGNVTGFCEHISGLNTREDSRFGGLNMCGGMMPIKFK